MEQVTLSAETRTGAGSRPARRLRREGKVPAIVYGRDLTPRSVAVARRDLRAALRTEAGLNALINLELGDDSVLTVAREIQRHPVRGEITHVDFIKVSLDVAIEAEVGIEYEGVPLGVREGGGIVETLENTVLVEALPQNVPSSISLDISELEVGDTAKVSDLPVIEGVTYVHDLEYPLATVVLPRMVVEEELEAVSEEEGALGAVPGELAAAGEAAESAEEDES